MSGTQKDHAPATARTGARARLVARLSAAHQKREFAQAVARRRVRRSRQGSARNTRSTAPGADPVEFRLGPSSSTIARGHEIGREAAPAGRRHVGQGACRTKDRPTIRAAGAAWTLKCRWRWRSPRREGWWRRRRTSRRRDGATRAGRAAPSWRTSRGRDSRRPARLPLVEIGQHRPVAAPEIVERETNGRSADF